MSRAYWINSCFHRFKRLRVKYVYSSEMWSEYICSALQRQIQHIGLALKQDDEHLNQMSINSIFQDSWQK